MVCSDIGIDPSLLGAAVAGTLRAMFVTFEGIDGAGKSTLIEALARRLRLAGQPVLITREPGAGLVGAAIRDILLHGPAIPAETELFLFLADRANHAQTIVTPALNQMVTVLCDRHTDSTLVYQGYGRGLDLKHLRSLNAYAVGSLMPNLTFLLDLPVEVSAERDQKGDRLDQESLEFRQRVRQGFLTEAAREPGRWRVLDATQLPEVVADQAWAELSASLAQVRP